MDKLTRSARGQECQIRIPGICNYDPATTVFAHLNGAGMGMKASSIHGAYACSDCHTVVDGGNAGAHRYERETLKLWHLDAIIRTQRIMLQLGLIKI